MGLADARGVTLSELRFRVSGHSDVKGSAILPLSLLTGDGEVSATPTLIARSNPDQPVMFDDLEPIKFVRARSKKIGCTPTIARQLERGRVRRRLDIGIQFDSFAGEHHKKHR